MAHFHAVGTIATDLVRRETKRGVLASFRLATTVHGTSKLWITAEAWGHTAGILNTHGTVGRGVALSGRLTYNSWRDRNTNAKKSSLVVTIDDLDFLDHDIDPATLTTPNHVIAVGKVTTDPAPDTSGDRLLFEIASGQAGAKTGRLWLTAESWGRTLDTARQLRSGDIVAVAGPIGYRSRPDHDGEKISRYEVAVTTLANAKSLAVTD